MYLALNALWGEGALESLPVFLVILAIVYTMNCSEVCFTLYLSVKASLKLLCQCLRSILNPGGSPREALLQSGLQQRVNHSSTVTLGGRFKMLY